MNERGATLDAALKNAAILLRTAAHYAPDQAVSDQNRVTGEWLKTRGLATVLRSMADELESHASAQSETRFAFPEPTAEQALSGWVFNFDWLTELSKKAEEICGETFNQEAIEAVLIAFKNAAPQEAGMVRVASDGGDMPAAAAPLPSRADSFESSAALLGGVASAEPLSTPRTDAIDKRHVTALRETDFSTWFDAWGEMATHARQLERELAFEKQQNAEAHRFIRELRGDVEAARSSGRRTTPHMIADNVSDEAKSTAFEWLRGMALGTPAAVNDPRAKKLAAIAQDEWHRLRELEEVRPAEPALSESPLAWVVFLENDPQGYDYRVFPDEQSANDFVGEQDETVDVEAVPLYRSSAFKGVPPTTAATKEKS